MAETNKNIENTEAVDGQSEVSRKHCLNCGAELMGHYCHNCGQEVADKTPTVTGFILAYLDNAYLWDTKFFKTIWTLIRRPGYLTNEFLAGKYSTHMHPLKLNMFLLGIFIMLFVFFASADKMTESVHNITYDERVFSGVQLQTLTNDPEYAKKMEESPRDTVLLHAPLQLAESHPLIISNIETKEDAEGDELDKWVAVLPQVFIEDEIIVIDDSGYYHFNTEVKIGTIDLELTNLIWAEIVRITSQYFPMLMLLTAPILSASLALAQRRRRLPRINHFIFALHYTALLEFLIICIYILHLTIAPPMDVLQYVMMISSCVYLTIAYHRVYTSTWFRSIVKSLLTSLIYLTILLLILMVIFIIACFIIAINMI